jgi:hypothetical protein
VTVSLCAVTWRNKVCRLKVGCRRDVGTISQTLTRFGATQQHHPDSQLNYIEKLGSI